MPLRGPDNKEYTGEEWDADGDEPDQQPVDLPPIPEEQEEAEQAAGTLTDEEIIITGEKDPETGMLPVLLRTLPKESPPVPPMRGRHVGGQALAVLSRVPLVGLKHLRASSEFVVYDDQPPPSGEYAVQSLGVTTVEYDGVKQNHLLVSFKAGQLTGFGVEDTYDSEETTYAAGADQEIDIATQLGGRKARTIVIECNRNIQVKLNEKTNAVMSIHANQSPFVIDLGLNIDYIYLTTVKDTKVRIKGW